MTLTELLDELYDEIDAEGINLTEFGIYDEEDLNMFAIRYLMHNLKDAFSTDVDELDEEEDELVAL
jgi:hypothetical protein